MEKSLTKLIDFDYDETGFDASNPLVLPGKKHKDSHLVIHKKRTKQTDAGDEKILSKRKRKELEKTIARKEKKLTRSELWKELESLQSNTQPAALSILPLFNRTKKHKKKDENSLSSSKGKSWRVPQSSSSEASKSTDEYSSEDEEVREEPEKPPLVDVTDEKFEVSNMTVASTSPHTPPTIVDSSKDYELTAKAKPKPAQFVLVSRTPDVIANRLTLPIIAEEANIMEAISENDCVIICGSTGCGKTTQVPQFLYEAGYSRNGYTIGVTEPRRVAAISMSQRVGEELNLPSNKVSYHIRYEKTAARDTEIKFMTDGVLLQEMKQDFELSRYSAIIVDEAHERSIFTDVLLGLISIVLRLRRRRFLDQQASGGQVLCPLKLIIMSATLRVADFAENRRLFPQTYGRPPPVIEVESRQYPVTCHFAKVTRIDYLKATFRKREVLTLCSWLSRAFANHTITNKTSEGNPTEGAGPRQHRRRSRGKQDTGVVGEAVDAVAPETESASGAAVSDNGLPLLSRINLDNFDIIPNDEEVELGMNICKKVEVNELSTEEAPRGEGDLDLDEFDDDGEILDEINRSQSQAEPPPPVYALPLYSLLSPERQQLVFQPPPEGHRLVVVATNVAETSLTIPNIRYVVDSGKVKTKVYNTVTGASSFEIVWVSQASAEQRAGRAGRIAPGHCFRLYSSQVFSSMQEFATPDILTRPIDDVVLMLKSYLGSTPLSRFPLPTWPSESALIASERRLLSLGALQSVKTPVTTGAGWGQCQVTRAGRWMARLPLPPRFARMLLFANQHQLMSYAVCLVAGLSVPDLFFAQPVGEKSEQEMTATQEDLDKFRANFAQQFVRRSADLHLGDLAVLLGTICCLERYAAQLTGVIPAEPGILELCGGAKRVAQDPEAALRLLVERCGVRWNAFREVRHLRRQLTEILNANIPDLDLPFEVVLPRPTALQADLLRQLFLVGSVYCVATRFSGAIQGLPRKERRRLRHAYQVPGVSGPVFIDPSSPLARENCSFIAFLELHTTSTRCLRTVCSIDPQWLPFLAPNNYTVEGLVLTDEKAVEATAMEAASPEHSSNDGSDFDIEAEAGELSAPPSSGGKKTKTIAVSLPNPRYDAMYDTVLTGAKAIQYFTTGLVSGEKGESSSAVSQFQLPLSLLVPVNSPAAVQSLGASEARMWSVRWFARALLEGDVFVELKNWFPSRIRVGISPSLLTVSWGIVKPEVRKLIGPLVNHNIDSRQALLAKWQSDTQWVFELLSHQKGIEELTVAA